MGAMIPAEEPKKEEEGEGGEEKAKPLIVGGYFARYRGMNMFIDKDRQ